MLHSSSSQTTLFSTCKCEISCLTSDFCSSDEINLKTALMNTFYALLEAFSFHNYETLVDNELADLDIEKSIIMPKLFFVTRYNIAEVKESCNLAGVMDKEDEVLDAAINRFFSLTEATKIWTLFKKRHLITPLQNAAFTPNSSMIKGAATGVYADEFVERLLPKIFDDVQMKGWHGNLYDEEQNKNNKIVGNIDTRIATRFIEHSLANTAKPEQEPLQVISLFAFQKERVDEEIIKILSRFNTKMADLKQRIQKPIPETELANEIYAIKNGAVL